jgi:hypothetical protein
MILEIYIWQELVLYSEKSKNKNIKNTPAL